MLAKQSTTIRKRGYCWSLGGEKMLLTISGLPFLLCAPKLEVRNGGYLYTLLAFWYCFLNLVSSKTNKKQSTTVR